MEWGFKWRIRAGLAAAVAVLSACGGDLAPGPVRPTSGTHVPALQGHIWPVIDVALNADGRIALSGDEGGYLRLWDTATGELLRVFNHASSVSGVALSAEGHVAASIGFDDMRLWDTFTGEVLRVFHHDNDPDLPAWGSRVSLSGRGHLALSMDDDLLRIWDTGTGDELHSFSHGGADSYGPFVFDAVLSADGRRAASAGSDGYLRIWDAGTGKELHALRHLGDGEEPGLGTLVIGAALSGDGRYAVSGGSDGVAWLWDATSGRRLRSFDHAAQAPFPPSDFYNPVEVSISANGNLMLSFGFGGVAMLWNRGLDEPMRIFGPRLGVSTVSLSSSGDLAIAGGFGLEYVGSPERPSFLEEGMVYVWDTTEDGGPAQAMDAGGQPNVSIFSFARSFTTDSGNYAKAVELRGHSRWADDGGTVEYDWKLYDQNGRLVDGEKGTRWDISLTKPGSYIVRLTATNDDGAQDFDEEFLHLPDTKAPTAVISGLPDSAQGQSIVVLSGLTSSDDDGEIVRYAWSIGPYWSESSSLQVALGPGIHTVYLTVVDNHGAINSVEETIYLEPDPEHYGVTIYNDNVIVLDLDRLEEDISIATANGRLFLDYPWVVYTYFEDAFDYLMLFSNFDEKPEQVFYYGIYWPMQNAIEGIGRLDFDDTVGVGSRGRLQGIMHFPNWDAIERGPVLHEIMHTWANYVIPSMSRSHFGFSNVHAQTGGFRDGQPVRQPEFDRDDGKAWLVPGIEWWRVASGSGESGPYSPIELYLAGLIRIDEVPDLRAAPSAYPLHAFDLSEDTESYTFDDRGYVLDEDGNHVWIVPGWEEHTPTTIMSRFGPRQPPVGSSQTEFTAAAILLVDDDHPATEERLKALSASVATFSRKGNDGTDYTNFHEATGGRAAITMDGLRALRKPTPGLPRFADPGQVSLARARMARIDPEALLCDFEKVAPRIHRTPRTTGAHPE